MGRQVEIRGQAASGDNAEVRCHSAHALLQILALRYALLT